MAVQKQASHDRPALAKFAAGRGNAEWCGDLAHARKVWSGTRSRKQIFVAHSVKKIYPYAMPALPPLNALRAFEAAARHLSMKEAAAELSVTPGAVSQLVRGLEQRLGTQLFRRGNRSLVLTEAGQSYFAPIRHAFRQIGEATRRLRAQPDAGVLTVSAPPAFAASWLVPLLGRFRALHTDIELTSLPRADWRISLPTGSMSRSATAWAAIPGCAATGSPLRDGSGLQPGVCSLARRLRGPADLLDCRCCTTRERTLVAMVPGPGRAELDQPHPAASASTTRRC